MSSKLIEMVQLEHRYLCKTADPYEIKMHCLHKELDTFGEWPKRFILKPRYFDVKMLEEFEMEHLV